MVVTRFAPSPTGNLHIGGARTALFNWLYARNHNGKFLLRIEDTDRERSSDVYTQSITDQLTWLGLNWDGDVISQFANRVRHVEVANQLLAMGKAYYCYASKEELDELRAAQTAAKTTPGYDGRWRDRDPSEAPTGVQPVIRIKAPRIGQTTITDLVQGTVTVNNSQLDDMVLVRADGTPTYMLSVVVDDYDSGVTHVIRGDDHLNNTFRQLTIIDAMGWNRPTYSHIPLIHGEDGKKLSKRNVAPSVTSYKDAGYLPDAICNYILRMGWGHGDDEIISKSQAISWFDVVDVSKGASRLDQKKLDHLNSVYMKNMDKDVIIASVIPIIKTQLGHDISVTGLNRIDLGFDEVLKRSHNMVQLASNLLFYADDNFKVDITSVHDLSKEILLSIKVFLYDIHSTYKWDHDHIEVSLRKCADMNNLKFGKLAGPLRTILTGMPVSPSLFEVIYVLGYDETCWRINQVITGTN